MAVVVPNAAEDVMLQNIVNKTAPQNWRLKLYTNDYTPVAGSTEANFTEANFTGYAAITLTGASWSIVAGSPTQATYAEQTFTSTADQSAQTVYGVYAVQQTSGKIMFAERFASARVVQNNGDNIKYTPRFSGASVNSD